MDWQHTFSTLMGVASVFFLCGFIVLLNNCDFTYQITLSLTRPEDSLVDPEPIDAEYGHSHCADQGNDRHHFVYLPKGPVARHQAEQLGKQQGASQGAGESERDFPAR